MRKEMIFIMLITCFVSCGRNFYEAKYVSKDFTREYTGLDTIIRIDGYYYREESTGKVGGPFIVSSDRKFQILYVIYENHIRLQERLSNNKYPLSNGSYTLLGDTIKVRWALGYDLGSYEIFSEQYLIINDTTLRRIWSLCETCEKHDGKKREPVKNEMYKFYKYP